MQFNAPARAAFYASSAAYKLEIGMPLMGEELKVGDHVTRNSEAGYVSGLIVKVHTRNVDYQGNMHHASKGDPQYGIQAQHD